MSLVGVEPYRISPAPGFIPARLRIRRHDRLLLRSALAGIGLSAAIMIAASAVRPDWMAPVLVMPRSGPPWELRSVHLPVAVVTVSLWIAAVLGGAGVAGALTACRRGMVCARPRVLPAAGLAAVAMLTVLPPVGSSDIFDYAAYGRMVEIGRSPYVTAPYQLAVLHRAYGQSIPVEWNHQVTLYGPVATAEQYAAAELGGSSAARVVFWLKLFNAVAFSLVAVGADRFFRHDPAARQRAHVLWTANPLLLWGLIAAGHLDVLAAAAGMLGVSVLPGARYGRARHVAAEQDPLRAALAGATVGVAADIKIFYVLFGLGLCWALRRRPGLLAAAAAGMLGVLLPTYAWFGPPAVQALAARTGKTTADTFYQFLGSPGGFLGHHAAVIALVAAVALAVAGLSALPAGNPRLPAVAPALALSAAWLFVWPYQLPWYDVMVVGLLVLYPASRLDWLVLARLSVATLALMPGNPWPPPGRVLGVLATVISRGIAPAVLLCAAAGLALLCASGRLGRRRQRAEYQASTPSSASPAST
jgi:alpha-1,6-mannosyltransferase